MLDAYMDVDCSFFSRFRATTKNSDFDFPEISGKHTISGTQKMKPAASNRSPYRWVKADPWFSWARWEGGLTGVMCLSSLYLPYHKRSQLLLVGLGRCCCCCCCCYCCCCCSNSCFECDIGFQIWTEIVYIDEWKYEWIAKGFLGGCFHFWVLNGWNHICTPNFHTGEWNHQLPVEQTCETWNPWRCFMVLLVEYGTCW